jgi:hypothetical protein
MSAPRATMAAVALALASLLAACAESSGEAFPRVTRLGDGEVFPVILNSSLAVGSNRLIMQLTDTADEQVLGADVRLAFYDLTGEEPRLTDELDARYIPLELSYEDELAGGEATSAGSSGAYIANVDFDRAGEWGVKVAVRHDGRVLEEAPFRFTVREESSEPGIGDAAPRSTQQTLANAASIEDIDSSYPPRPAMHDVTIADAIASGRPAVIAFATPAFCRSRTCAPVMDTVMDPLHEKYGDRAAFIHVEPYVLRDLRASFAQNAVPAAREWRLESEPWIFVVDGAGIVAGKFEGIVAADEVEAALVEALAGSS